MSDTFPRQYARTQRFTLGDPRTISVSADGQRVAFARSRAGDDPVNCLWVLDVATGEERLVADPLQLLDAIDDEFAGLPAEQAGYVELSCERECRDRGGRVGGVRGDATSAFAHPFAA